MQRLPFGQDEPAGQGKKRRRTDSRGEPGKAEADPASFLSLLTRPAAAAPGSRSHSSSPSPSPPPSASTVAATSYLVTEAPEADDGEDDEATVRGRRAGGADEDDEGAGTDEEGRGRGGGAVEEVDDNGDSSTSSSVTALVPFVSPHYFRFLRMAFAEEQEDHNTPPPLANSAAAQVKGEGREQEEKEKEEEEGRSSFAAFERPTRRGEAGGERSARITSAAEASRGRRPSRGGLTAARLAGTAGPALLLPSSSTPHSPTSPISPLEPRAALGEGSGVSETHADECKGWLLPSPWSPLSLARPLPPSPQAASAPLPRASPAREAPVVEPPLSASPLSGSLASTSPPTSVPGSPSPSSTLASSPPPLASPAVSSPSPRVGLQSTSFVTGYYERFFRRGRRLGGGSFGAVYLTSHVLEDVELGVFACKIIPVGDSYEWLLRVSREIRALEAVHHRHVVSYKHSWLEQAQIADHGPTVPCLFVLMEYCNQGTAADLVWPHQSSSTAQEEEVEEGQRRGAAEGGFHQQRSHDSACGEQPQQRRRAEVERIKAARRQRRQQQRTQEQQAGQSEAPRSPPRAASSSSSASADGYGGAVSAQFLLEEDVWWLFLDCCLGLRHLHRCCVVHNDLKLENLLLTADTDARGRVQARRLLISDMGNAVIKGAEHHRTGMTGTLQVHTKQRQHTDTHQHSSRCWR